MLIKFPNTGANILFPPKEDSPENLLTLLHLIQLGINIILYYNFLNFGQYPALCFYLKQRFADWTVPLFSGEMPSQLGPIDRTSPYLRAPETLF
jgi:hypothetical protein